MFYKNFMGLLGGGALAVGSLLAYANRIHPLDVEVVEVEVRLARLSREFDGYRVAQISDIHTDRWMSPRRLARLLYPLDGLEADLIVMTGDFITDPGGGRAGELAAALARLSAPDGKLGVLGNYDYDAGEETVRRVLREGGVTELSNEVYTVERGGVPLHFAGVDDLWWRRARLDLVLKRLPEEGAAVLAAHEPDFADLAAPTGRFDLQLSGHTHGGQVRLPLVGPVLRPRYGTLYHTGGHRVDGMEVYTNRGLGMFPPHLRFRCRPEITVFTLRSPTRG